MLRSLGLRKKRHRWTASGNPAAQLYIGQLHLPFKPIQWNQCSRRFFGYFIAQWQRCRLSKCHKLLRQDRQIGVIKALILPSIRTLGPESVRLPRCCFSISDFDGVVAVLCDEYLLAVTLFGDTYPMLEYVIE